VSKHAAVKKPTRPAAQPQRRRTGLIAAIVGSLLVVLLVTALMVQGARVEAQAGATVTEFFDALNHQEMERMLKTLDPEIESFFTMSGHLMAKNTTRDIAEMLPFMLQFGLNDPRAATMTTTRFYPKIVGTALSDKGTAATVTLEVTLKDLDTNISLKPLRGDLRLVKYEGNDWRIDETDYN